MVDQELENAPAEEEVVEAPAEDEGTPVMCFVSKQMVPESQTVEVEYSRGKPVRVHAKYIRYATEEASA